MTEVIQRSPFAGMTVAVYSSRDITKSEQLPIFVGQFGTNGTDRDFLRSLYFFPPSPILFHSSWPTRVGVCSCSGGVRTAHDAEWNSLEQMEHFGTPSTCSTLFRLSYFHFVSLVSPDRGGKGRGSCRNTVIVVRMFLHVKAGRGPVIVQS